MQFSEQWLRSFVDPDLDSEALAHLLTMSGLEVEERRPVAPAFTSVVVAKVLEVVPHPNADRLRLCTVDTGAAAPLSIVCGAPNVAAGMIVPCATVGASLPGGLNIKRAAVRGIESEGMLCSARELGLSEDAAGLMPLAADSMVGKPLREALGLDDTLMVLKLTPIRADCLSLLGVAREVAALTGAPMQSTDCAPVPATIADRLQVSIDAAAHDLCGRFSGRVIRGVDAHAPTPDWMKQRLEQIKFLDVTTSMLTSGVPFPVIPESAEIMNIIVPDMMQNALSGRMSVAGASDHAAKQVKDILNLG
jgi:phenylalanyl-tRNA synthetase beta chain